MHQGPAEFVGRFEGRAKGRSGAAKRFGDLVLQMVVAAADHCHVGRHPTEGIGFVHEPGSQDALQGMISSIAAIGGRRNISADLSRRKPDAMAMNRWRTV